jgi:hypothetical protein
MNTLANIVDASAIASIDHRRAVLMWSPGTGRWSHSDLNILNLNLIIRTHRTPNLVPRWGPAAEVPL